MGTFRRILFTPLARGDNDRALAAVAALAKRHRATISVLASIAEPSRLQRLLHDASFFEEVQYAQSQAMLDEIRHWCQRAGCPDVDVEVEIGSAALAVLRRVHVEAHDLVVITSDSIASDHATVRRLLRKSPCPVWVIRPARVATDRILVAIDPNPAEEALNRRILELAATMAAGSEHPRVHVVHAWELYGEATLRSPDFQGSSVIDLEELSRRQEDVVRAAMDDLLKNVHADATQWVLHVEKGEPVAVLTKVIDDENVDLLVIGTVARSGVSGLVMGNTAERVLDAVSCGVLAVKPPGFTSPIQFGRRSPGSDGWMSTPL